MSPIFEGAVLALLAALSFGSATPFVELAGRNAGPLATAAFLYLGACLSALLLRTFTRQSGARLTRRHLGRLALVAFFGAAIAPTLLAWGLKRAGATTGSLLLNMEAVFTVFLALAFHREPIGRRVAIALLVMTIAGGLLTFDATGAAGGSTLATLAIVGATLAWALDNTLTRPLAELNPLSVVAAKGALGAVLTGMLSLALRETLPRPSHGLTLLTCGATGYGLSLRLYLLAQRRIGAARTGSIFALGPFVGAALAWLLGTRSPGALTGVSAGLFGLGVFLHLTERHRHLHQHVPLEHEHAHQHDDGHHDHAHEPPVKGEHTHAHRHGPLVHDHEHAPDIHHRHGHS